MDFRSIATERVSCDPPATKGRTQVRYGSERRIVFQTPRMRVRAVKSRFSMQMHRILDGNTVPLFESFLEDILSRVQSTAGLDLVARIDQSMPYIELTDETMVFDSDGIPYDDDITQGNEYMVSCIIALTGIWVQSSESGTVVSWGPVWQADQVKLYETLVRQQEGRVFFNGKPFFRLDN